MAPQSPLDDRRPAITPQLALRVAVLGGIAFALFAIVFFRLWFLQVLSGEEYVSQARENRVRKVKIEAPVSLQLVREIVLAVGVNAVLAVPVYAFVRRVVAPYLPDDPRRRRRRAYVTGGLSPISRA